MRKSDLFELVRQIAEIAPEDTPIIVGSQAVHIITELPPEIVQKSIECDFLFTGGKSETRAAVNKKFGVFSQFQLEHGFYADALGLATVVLPTGWEQRLQPLIDENGQTIAYCVEVHDIAVSKLIAGREKDFLFLKETFRRDYLDIEVFVERLSLMKEASQSAVLESRLKSLKIYIDKSQFVIIKQFLKGLQK